MMRKQMIRKKNTYDAFYTYLNHEEWCIAKYTEETYLSDIVSI